MLWEKIQNNNYLTSFRKKFYRLINGENINYVPNSVRQPASLIILKADRILNPLLFKESRPLLFTIDIVLYYKFLNFLTIYCSIYCAPWPSSYGETYRIKHLSVGGFSVVGTGDKLMGWKSTCRKGWRVYFSKYTEFQMLWHTYMSCSWSLTQTRMQSTNYDFNTFLFVVLTPP